MNITNLTSYYYHEAALKQTCPRTWRSYWDKYTVATCTHRPATRVGISPHSPKTCVWHVNVHTVLSHESSALCSFITDVCSNRRITFRTENTEFIQDSKCLCSSKLPQSCKRPATEDREWASEAQQQVSAQSIRMAPNFFPQAIWTNVTVICSWSQQHPLLPALTVKPNNPQLSTYVPLLISRIFRTIHTRAFKWSQGTTCRICQNNNCQLFTSETPGAIRQLQLSEQPPTRVLFD